MLVRGTSIRKAAERGTRMGQRRRSSLRVALLQKQKSTALRSVRRRIHSSVTVTTAVRRSSHSEGGRARRDTTG
jgi:hypothetical protein